MHAQRHSMKGTSIFVSPSDYTLVATRCHTFVRVSKGGDRSGWTRDNGAMDDKITLAFSGVIV